MTPQSSTSTQLKNAGTKVRDCGAFSTFLTTPPKKAYKHDTWRTLTKKKLAEEVYLKLDSTLINRTLLHSQDSLDVCRTSLT